MKLIADRDILKGEIIVQGMSVGPNADTLINTGFLNNPNPTVYCPANLEVEITPETPFGDAKIALIEAGPQRKFRMNLF